MSSGEWIVPRGVVRVRVNVTSSGESSGLYHMEWSGLGLMLCHQVSGLYHVEWSGLGLMLRRQVSQVDCTTWSGQG